MNKSIEKSWKEAFKNQKLAAPKIINLYERKSNMLVDKMMRRMRIDNWLLLLFSVIIIPTGYAFDYGLESLYIAAMLILFFFLNKWRLGKVSGLRLEDDPLTYLTDFRSWIKSTISFYNKFLGFGLPFIMGPLFYMILSHTDSFQRLIKEDGYLPATILIIILCVFMGGWSTLSYYFSNKVQYGGLLKRINETINELEELSV